MPSGQRGYLSRADKQALSEPAKDRLPDPPDDLAGYGREVYRLLAAQASWLGEADWPLALQLCRLESECEDYRRILAQDGPVLTEPIVTARGDVVGERKVSHPAVTNLRKAEASLEKVRTALALPPQLRARLGLKTAPASREAAAVAGEETARQVNLLARYQQAAGQ